MEPNDYHSQNYGTGFIMKAAQNMAVEDIRLIRNHWFDSDQESDAVACSQSSSSSAIYGAYISDSVIGTFNISLTSDFEISDIVSFFVDDISGHTLIAMTHIDSYNNPRVITHYLRLSSRSIMMSCKESVSSSHEARYFYESGRDFYISRESAQTGSLYTWTATIDVNQSDSSKPLIQLLLVYSFEYRRCCCQNSKGKYSGH